MTDPVSNAVRKYGQPTYQGALLAAMLWLTQQVSGLNGSVAELATRLSGGLDRQEERLEAYIALAEAERNSDARSELIKLRSLERRLEQVEDRLADLQRDSFGGPP